MNKFKIGDVVMLNTGGPAMTVKDEILDGSTMTKQELLIARVSLDSNLVSNSNLEYKFKVRCTWFVQQPSGTYDGPYEFDFSEDQLTNITRTDKIS